MAKKTVLPETQKDDVLEINLSWDEKTIKDLDTVYANQMMITHGGKEFYIIFGEFVPPLTFKKAGPNRPVTAVVKPVVKIAIAPDVMVAFAAAIGDNVQRFLSRASDNVSVDSEEI